MKSARFQHEQEEVVISPKPAIKSNKPSRPAPQVKAPLSFEKEEKEFIEIPIERNYEDEKENNFIKGNNEKRIDKTEEKKGLFSAIIEKIKSLFKR
jgi:hypothetical protein